MSGSFLFSLNDREQIYFWAVYYIAKSKKNIDCSVPTANDSVKKILVTSLVISAEFKACSIMFSDFSVVERSSALVILVEFLDRPKKFSNCVS